MNYKILSAFLGVCVIVLLWLVTTPAKNQTGNLAPVIEQLNEQTPAGFPAEFVPPQGAMDVNNYTAKFEGRTDLNQQFTTEMSVSAVIAYYDKIFKANGWTPQTVVDEAKNKVVTATKGSLTTTLVAFQGANKETQLRLTVSEQSK